MTDSRQSVDYFHQRLTEQDFQTALANQISHNFQGHDQHLPQIKKLSIRVSSETRERSRFVKWGSETSENRVAEKSDPGLESAEVTRKQKCLEEVQKKFQWFQWNQFYLTNDKPAAHGTLKRKHGSDAETSPKLMKPEVEGKPEPEVSEKPQEAERVVVKLKIGGEKVQEILRQRKNTESAAKKADAPKPPSVQTTANEDRTVGTDLNPRHHEEDTKADCETKSFVWKKRLLIGYQQETRTEEVMTEQANAATVSHPAGSADEEVQIISEQKVFKAITPDSYRPAETSFVELPRAMPSICKETIISIADMSGRDPPRVLATNPELQIIPLRSEPPPPPPLNLVRQKTSFCITKVSSANTSGSVMEMRNFRKVQQGHPCHGQVGVVGSANGGFYPPDMSARRLPPPYPGLQHALPPYPMPSLERIPVPYPQPPRPQPHRHPPHTASAGQQLVPLQPVSWILQGSQPVYPVLPAGDKRDGTFYSSAKNFILSDDSFSLAAH
jgi:hypothetical protein